MATVPAQVAHSIELQQAKSMSRKVAKESKGAHKESTQTRSWKMLEEAVEFKIHIDTLQKGVASLESATLAFFKTTIPLLSVPLPRVWQKAEGGLAEPLRVVETHGHQSVAGGDYLSVQMRAAVTAFDKRTKSDIRKPLVKWLEAMDAVRDRFADLERTRHDMEKRLKLVAQEEAMLDAQDRASKVVVAGGHVGGTGGGDQNLLASCFRACTHPQGGGRVEEMREAPSVTDELPEVQIRQEDTAIRLKDKARKLQVVRQAFEEQEQLIFEQLSGLCRDACWTKTYMAGEMMILKDLFQEAPFYLGTTKQPLPMFPNPPNQQKIPGAIAGNEDIIFGTPLILERHERKAALEDTFAEERVVKGMPLRTVPPAWRRPVTMPLAVTPGHQSVPIDQMPTPHPAIPAAALEPVIPEPLAEPASAV